MSVLTTFTEHNTGKSKKHSTIKKNGKHIFSNISTKDMIVNLKKSLKNISQNVLKQISGFNKVTGCKLLGSKSWKI